MSKKGQIVVPAKYRDRLGIEPGMKVSFRIRGQVLVVELDTDIDKDLEYLRGKKGKLGEADLAEGGIQEIIMDLLSQQFYRGDDTLTDRVGRESVKIRGSDAILQEVVSMLHHSARYWMNGDYIETLREFADNLELDFPTLLSRLVQKLKNMEVGGQDMISLMGGEVIFSMAIGEAITQFRVRVGDQVTELIYKEAQELGYVKRLGEETVEELVARKLADHYSILMNLRVLRELARSSVRTIGKRDFEKYNNSLIESFVSEKTPEHIIKRRERRIKRLRRKGIEVDEEEFLYNPTVDDDDDEEMDGEIFENDLPDLPSFDY
ncbi:MAG: AbrB/MazE/SpoVT family DNA-binding domain-containing protein [Candidatus Heimdallarchaeota archaeon]|nr:AbrB/MazE/SpoVT family DNA-binding domain-containing protein [Candidatus Heimdallarchaeota archaeon]